MQPLDVRACTAECMPLVYATLSKCTMKTGPGGLHYGGALMTGEQTGGALKLLLRCMPAVYLLENCNKGHTMAAQDSSLESGTAEHT